MVSTEEWTKLKVTRRRERNVFTLLSRAFPEVPAESLNEGAKIQVVRADNLFDEGEVKIIEEEMSGRGWDSFFLGFRKIVPDEKRLLSNIGIRASIMPSLKAEWFQEGDQVRLEVNSLKFRISLSVLNRPVCLIRHSKKRS